MKKADSKGILLGQCNGPDEAQEREEIRDRLWQSAISVKSYMETLSILDEPYQLLREALNCYSTCAYMGTAIICRSVVESTVLKMVLCRDLEWEELSDHSRMIRYEISPCHKYLEDYRNATGELESLYPDLFEKIKAKTKEVREKGNFVAHYTSKVKRGFEKVFLSPVKLWIFPDESERLLMHTISILTLCSQTLSNATKKPIN